MQTEAHHTVQYCGEVVLSQEKIRCCLVRRLKRLGAAMMEKETEEKSRVGKERNETNEKVRKNVCSLDVTRQRERCRRVK
jgi:hypothetical protein